MGTSGDTAAGLGIRALADRPGLPKSEGHAGRNFANNRLVVERMLYRLRNSLPWRDLPDHFGTWQTMWKRHRRYAADGTWDRVLTAVIALADTTGDLDWVVSVDSTIVRAHQHSAGARADSVTGL